MDVVVVKKLKAGAGDRLTPLPASVNVRRKNIKLKCVGMWRVCFGTKKPASARVDGPGLCQEKPGTE